MPTWEEVPYLPIGELAPAEAILFDSDPRCPGFVGALQSALASEGYLDLQEGGFYGAYNYMTAEALARYVTRNGISLPMDGIAGCAVYRGLGLDVKRVACWPEVSDRVTVPYPGYLCSELLSETCQTTITVPEEKAPNRIIGYALIGTAALLTAWGITRRT